MLDDPMGTARVHLTSLAHELERVEPLQRMADLLAVLRDDRAAHYLTEESPGGLFEDLLSRRPSWERRVRLLEAQHPEMLADLDSLQDRLARVEDELRRIRLDAHALLQVMEAHERVEADLILGVHYIDIGSAE